MERPSASPSTACVIGKSKASPRVRPTASYIARRKGGRCRREHRGVPFRPSIREKSLRRSAYRATTDCRCEGSPSSGPLQLHVGRRRPCSARAFRDCDTSSSNAGSADRECHRRYGKRISGGWQTHPSSTRQLRWPVLLANHVVTGAVLPHRDGKGENRRLLFRRKAGS